MSWLPFAGIRTTSLSTARQVRCGSSQGGKTMYISNKASRIRQREAQRARDNRAEIVKARSTGQITRRDLIRWGIFTSGGLLVCKNGLSPFAPSAFAAIQPARRAARYLA